jgi:hypothetical protein
MRLGPEDSMKSRGFSTASLHERVIHEVKEYIIIAVYLYIVFTALVYFKATILHAHGIPFAPFGFAAIKALVFAKFMSVGFAFRLGERFKTLPLAYATLYKSFVFLLLLLLLNALEEIAVGLIHHRTIMASLLGISGGRLDELLASSFVGLLILLPFFAFRALGEVMGEGNLIRLFLVSRQSTGGVSASPASPG